MLTGQGDIDDSFSHSSHAGNSAGKACSDPTISALQAEAVISRPDQNGYDALNATHGKDCAGIANDSARASNRGKSPQIFPCKHLV